MKVFVTVGSMLPFDRLIRAVDEIAGGNDSTEFFAQIGDSKFLPENMPFVKMLSPAEFRERAVWSDLILSHAGMGTVITAAECKKRLVALPRKPQLGEVTSEHQIATARWLKDRAGITVIDSEKEVEDVLRKISSDAVVDLDDSGTRENLISALRGFIFS